MADVKQRAIAAVNIDLTRSPKPGAYDSATLTQTRVVLEVPLTDEELLDQKGEIRRLLTDAVDRAVEQATETLDRQIKIAKAERRAQEAEEEDD